MKIFKNKKTTEYVVTISGSDIVPEVESFISRKEAIQYVKSKINMWFEPDEDGDATENIAVFDDKLDSDGVAVVARMVWRRC